MLTQEQTDAIDAAAAKAAARVRAVEDPEARVRAATKAMDAAAAKAKEYRVGTRDPALLAMHFRYGALPVKCYTPLALSRNLLARLFRDYRKALARNEAPELPTYPKGLAGAQRAAVDAQRRILRHTAVITAVRKVRDDTAEDMLHCRVRKPDGSIYNNADVAKILGLTTARVSQLRQGTRGQPKGKGKKRGPRKTTVKAKAR